MFFSNFIWSREFLKIVESDLPYSGHKNNSEHERYKRSKGVARRQRVCLSMFSVTGNSFLLLISTQSMTFWHTDFLLHTMYSMNPTLATQTHALTRTRYFCCQNAIISLSTTYNQGLGHLFVFAIASLSLPLSRVFVAVIQSLSLYCSCKYNIDQPFARYPIKTLTATLRIFYAMCEGEIRHS